MPRPLFLLFVLGIFTAISPVSAQQAQPNPAEAKLREGLRNTMLQLRTMQAERDQLLVDKATLENEKKDTTDKLEALTKQAAANQDAAQKSIAALEAKVTVGETELSQYKESLEKWKASQKQAVDLATKKESERATAANRVIELDRQVADQQRKNAAMYKVGIEVLHRYEKFVLGDALAAREPFTGIARVKFQTLAQDFQDQLTDQVIKPEPAKPAAKAAPATPTPTSSKAAKPKSAAAKPVEQPRTAEAKVKP